MLKRREIFLFTVLLCACFACNKSNTPTDSLEKYIRKSQSSASKLMSTLKKALLRAVKKGGLENAIFVCGSINEKLMKEMNMDPDFFIHRVSLKNRSSKNVPDSYETALIKQMEEDLREGKLKDEYYELVELKDMHVFRWLKPIVIQKVCLNCHGKPEKMNKAILATLHNNYPDDKALGYVDGQLRGAISVKIKVN